MDAGHHHSMFKKALLQQSCRPHYFKREFEIVVGEFSVRVDWHSKSPLFFVIEQQSKNSMLLTVVLELLNSATDAIIE
jgi:hypothetical protein